MLKSNIFLNNFTKSIKKLFKVEFFGLLLLSAIVLLAVFAPLVAGYGFSEVVCEPFSEPSASHILGCNDFGQDLLAQLLFGARTSLTVGLGVAFFSTFVATILALISGYNAGNVQDGKRGIWIDRVIMRSVDVTLSLPFLPLVIVLGVFLGSSLKTQIIVISLVMWAQPLRELRSQVLQLRTSGYVEASRSMGGKASFIMNIHILPDLFPLIVPQFIRIAHNAIMVEATISFLGLGDPLQASWGSTLYHANARTAFLTGDWVYWILPSGFAIALTVLSFALIGFYFEDKTESVSNSAIKKFTGKQNKVLLDNFYSKAKSDNLDNLNNLTNLKEQPILQIENFCVSYGDAKILKNINMQIKSGEIIGLVGESGSGKTTLGAGILQLLTQNAKTSGKINFCANDLENLSQKGIMDLRSNHIALIPQSAMNSLNPVLSIGNQIDEALRMDKSYTKEKSMALSKDWLQKVGLDARVLNLYPHQLSGGMKQRAVIAIALCRNPKFIIADEPTTGLDVLVQNEIIQLLLKLQKELNLSVLFITHNLPLVLKFADKISVMYKGELVETQTCDKIKQAPQHKHTKDLIKDLLSLEDESSNWQTSYEKTQVLRFENISKKFTNKFNGLFSKKEQKNFSLENINLTLHKGDTLGLVGSSGSGKSTIARLLLGMLKATDGDYFIKNKNIKTMNADEKKKNRQIVHLIFQDPYQSMNNKHSLFDIIAEPLIIHDISKDKNVQKNLIKQALRKVHLRDDDDFLQRKPIELSGGQRQRVAFARALVIEPEIIIADEPTSMLDQSIRMEIIQVMQELQQKYETGFLLITHDLALAYHFCDRIMVINEGKIVEEGTNLEIIKHPKNTYTKSLIENC